MTPARTDKINAVTKFKGYHLLSADRVFADTIYIDRKLMNPSELSKKDAGVYNETEMFHEMLLASF